MKEKKYKEFQKEVEVLADKYNVQNAAFCGTDDEEKFMGFIVGKPSYIKAMMCTLNIGRLWQHMRTSVRSILNGFEKVEG